MAWDRLERLPVVSVVAVMEIRSGLKKQSTLFLEPAQIWATVFRMNSLFAEKCNFGVDCNCLLNWH